MAIEATESDTSNEENERDEEENPYPPTETDERDITRIEIDVKEDPFQISALIKKIDSKPQQLIMRPDFQRQEVWDTKRRSAFIESILLNYPLPPLYLNQHRSGQYVVVDGLQRTSSFYRYFKDEFALTGLKRLHWLNDKKFSQIDSILQSRFEDRKLLCFVLRPSVPLAVVYDIFARINQGGMTLGRQEIRHGLYQGPSTTLLKSLAQTPVFGEWLGHRLNPKRMGDEEAALRCVAFTRADPHTKYQGDMDKFLELAMLELNEAKDEDIRATRATFERSFLRIREIIGDEAFRISTTKSRGRINIAIMESVYRFFTLHSEDWLVANAEPIKKNYSVLIRGPEFQNAVQSSTGDTAKVKTRFRLAREVLGGDCAD